MNAVKRNGKIFVALAFLMEIAVLFMYGFFSSYTMTIDSGTGTENRNEQFIFINIVMMLFLLIGFGLLMVYYKFNTWSGLAYTLFLAAFTLQLFPLYDRFWANVFLTGFNGGQIVWTPVSSFNNDIRAAIAMVVVLGAVVGRIGTIEALFLTFGGGFIYSLNRTLNIFVSQARSSTADIVDAGGAISVFYFAGVFGLMMGVALKTPSSAHHERYVSGPENDHAIVAMIGTAFLWAGFPIMNYNGLAHIQLMEITVMNTIYALSASVVTVYMLSALFHLRLGVNEAVHATLGGGVMIGACSSIIINPGISIFIGFAGGLFAFLGVHLLQKKMNNASVLTTQGTFGIFILPGLFSAVLSSILIACYKLYPTNQPLFLSVAVGMDGGATDAGYQMVNLSITLGVALLGGLLIGGISRALNQNSREDLFEDFVHFDEDFGLGAKDIHSALPADSEKKINNY